MIHTEAFYENGVLKLAHPLPFAPHSKVRVDITLMDEIIDGMMEPATQEFRSAPQSLEEIRRLTAAIQGSMVSEVRMGRDE